ncbi:NUDIX domain-containing protein [Avibacterium paragallinarum]|uniref:NUDIX domain-containing protein n=1 Tax=Avibacterium paragallinarum TaxID=728 RepID=UPI00021ACEAE|nr:NUDIX hydrolase [Avibacterium paragallinarum]AZI15084.1 NUDIX hydrolase [Avibacterium paragallinarum]MEE3609123.1 NUDIX hydrolase [Avibacterium paragallinarum]MEE3621072.1 NUDIX hydrolase [Avibacterium paragallinarum]MEE3668913.1 NUDIX hydrolase [Avibacterium paragallinarum]MEE3681135.1 NUDIX hydrolase [Avibacterium paragallinarum]
MYKPYITMACVVHCQGKFLFVKEFEYGKMTLNQPAGHLEQNESIIEGAMRELLEETGIRAKPSKLIKIYQWYAPRSQKDYLRFVFSVELTAHFPISPTDPDIEGGLWLTPEEFQHYIQQEGQAERNPLVSQALQDYLNGEEVSLDVLKVFE